MLALLAFVLTALAKDPDVSMVPPAAPPPSGDTAILDFKSTKPKLIISAITGRSTGYASTGQTVIAIGYKDLCTAPCTVETPVGFSEFYEFYGKGGGHIAMVHKIELRPGHTEVLIDPGSSTLRTIGGLAQWSGYFLAGFGGVFLALDEAVSPDDRLIPRGAEVAMLTGGVVLLGGGVALRVTNRGKWTVTPAVAPL